MSWRGWSSRLRTAIALRIAPGVAVKSSDHERAAAADPVVRAALDWITPALGLDELPVPWARILAAARCERRCSCGAAVVEVQLRYEMLAGANAGEIARRYSVRCDACGLGRSGNYATEWRL